MQAPLLAASPSRLLETAFDSDEESRIECVGRFALKIDLQHQHDKNTSLGRSAYYSESLPAALDVRS